jgi:hypothetical protein
MSFYDESVLNDVDGSLLIPRSKSKMGAKAGYDMEHFDFNVLSPVPKLAKLHNPSSLRAGALLRVARYTICVTALIMVNSQVMGHLAPEIAEDLGLAYVILGNAARFAAAPLYLLIMLQFNNYYSEKMYFKYLQNGALIKFPDTGNFRAMIRSWLPRLFLIYFTIYVVFALCVMFVLRTTFATVVMFLNIIAGIVSFWIRQQSITSSFVSLSSFLEAFPDADGQFARYDDVRLTTAALALTKLTVVEATAPSYNVVMRQLYWKLLNIGPTTRGMLRIAVYTVAFGTLAFAVWYSLYYIDQTNLDRWDEVLNPCVSACYRITQSVSEVVSRGDAVARALINDTWAVNRCYCECLRRLTVGTLAAEDCMNQLSVPNVDVNRTLCCRC